MPKKTARTGACLAAAAALFMTLLTAPSGAATTREINVESLVLEKVNGGRSGIGRSPLRMHSGLRIKARGHSVNMASRGGLTHDGFRTRVDTATPDPVESNGAPDDGFYSAGFAACENVAYTSASGWTDSQIAQKLYELWLYSTSGHKQCMFDTASGGPYGYTVTGIGVYFHSGSGRWYATMEVVKDRSLPSASTTPTPTPAPGTTWRVVEQNASSVTYTGTWYTYSTSLASGGSVRRSSTTGSKVRHSFTGTSVRWVGVRHPYAGITEVRLDGVAVARVDAWSSSSSWKQVLFERTGLSSGTHTIELYVTGQRNSRSSGIRTYIDAFQVR
ncbi:MAG TPA: CAP domain-containing protein [Actinomycetota bacterium]|nr:CAP domain-containing protein [Actinomycetota bacterium]